MFENVWAIISRIANFEMNFVTFTFKPIYFFYFSIIISVVRLFLFKSSSNGVETRGNSRLNSKAFKKVGGRYE